MFEGYLGWVIVYIIKLNIIIWLIYENFWYVIVVSWVLFCDCFVSFWFLLFVSYVLMVLVMWFLVYWVLIIVMKILNVVVGKWVIV